MGFDNECILNIQSLAGEYFCPVCRLLVYPNEAIQSQCTHLYCKPCLTYVVSTTRACPYDGYLVTEADAKPLLESNKALADTIGKIEIHCLYHRSGCTWQGPLSECTSHCSGCAFGNSPVVCNRCGIQIVHREVQEHAQNCPGVQSQAQQAGGTQDAAVTSVSSAADQNHTAAQVGAVSSQALTFQSTATIVPGKDGSQQSITNAQASVPTPDQWYQQQQQYQQYYQQFPGYDPYQQQYQMYYPYQQPAAPQYQQQQLQTHPPQMGQQPPPMQAQPPPAPAQPLSQIPTSAPPQNQIQANPSQQNHPAVQPWVPTSAPPQNQIQSQAPPPLHIHPQPHPYPQAQPNQNPQHIPPQSQHPQMPQYQHTHPQMQPPQSQPPRHPAPQPQPHPYPQAQPPVQPQNHLQPQPQPHQPPSQNPSAQAITGHHSYPQPQLQQQMLPGPPHQHSMHMQSQAGPYRPPQHPVQMQSQFSQQPPQMRPPLSQTPVQNIPPVQQQPIHPHAQQPGHAVHQRPVTHPVQQPMSQQYVQQPQPFVGQPSVSVQNHLNQQGPFGQHQLPMQSQTRPQAPAQQLQSYPHPHQNVAMPHGMQAHQSHFVGGRPTIPSEGLQSQPYAQSSGVEVRPTQQSANQHSTNQMKPAIPADQESKSPAQQMARKAAYEFDGRSYPKVDAGEKTPLKSETDMKSIVDEPKSVSEVDEKTKVDTSAKGIQEPMKTVGIDVKSKHVENREPVIKQEVKEEASLSNSELPNDGKSGEVMPMEHNGLENNGLKDGSGLKNYSSLQPTESSGEQHGKLAQTPGTQGPGLDEFGGLSAPGQGRHLPSFQQHRPGAHVLPFPPSQHDAAAPGHTYSQFRPQGSLQGMEVPPSVISGPVSTTSFGRGPSHYGPPHGSHIQGHMHPFHAGPLRPSQGDPFMGSPPGTSEFDSHAGMMAKPSSHGQQHPTNFEQGALGVHSNMTRINGAPGLDSSLPPGIRDERFKPPTDDHLNPFPADPSRLIMDHGEFEDGKRFPRPSLDAEPVPKSGSYFSSSRPVDMGSIMRSESTRGRPDFLRPIPGYGGHHMDGLAPRSPPREYPGISPRGFGGLAGIPGSRSGLDEVDGRHRFGDPYNDGRFRGLPGHLHRGEFEGHGNSRMGEHMRSGDLIDRNFLPGHLRRGEHFGPRHMFEDPAGYDHFSAHVQRGELGVSGGNFPHHLPPSKSFGGGRPNQRLGEPGFRSSFSLQGYPHDGGIYTGDMDSFDNIRKRKTASMGWCRICKVDCESVEGLDLHAQTREHQQNAMDMVQIIKQNAKKQKSISRDPSSFEDANKSMNANFGSRGNMC